MSREHLRGEDTERSSNIYWSGLERDFVVPAGTLSPGQEVEIPLFSAAIKIKHLNATLTWRKTLSGCRIGLGFQQELSLQEGASARTMTRKETSVVDSTSISSSQLEEQLDVRPSRKALSHRSLSKQLGERQLNADSPPSIRAEQSIGLGAIEEERGGSGEAQHTSNRVLSDFFMVDGEPERDSDGAEAQDETRYSTEWKQSVKTIETTESLSITAITLRCLTARQDCKFCTEIGEISLDEGPT